VLRRVVRYATAALVVTTAIGCRQQAGYAQQYQQPQDLAREIRELKATLAQQAEKIRELEGRLKAQESKSQPVSGQLPPDLSEKIDRHLESKIPAYPFMEGLDISGWVTTVVQGARNANGEDRLSSREDATDATYSADILLEKKLNEDGWGLLHFRAGNGAGLTDDLQLYSNVNYNVFDADNNVSIIEAWYEHYFKTVPFTATFGKLDAISYIDGNEYANDDTSQFLGDMFNNSPVIEWPSDNGAGGLRLAWEHAEFWTIDFLAMDSDGDDEDAYDAPFLAAQINVKPKLSGRNGNYRFILWQNRAPHTRWNDATRDKENGYGFGISFDQGLTDNLGMFLRYGWQDPDVYLNSEVFSLEQAYSFGPQVKGCAWGRPDDTVGLGFGQVFASKKYKQANNLIAKPETHLEWYYNFRANKHFTVSPDLQVIWRPYGQDAANGDGTIVVAGGRAELDF